GLGLRTRRRQSRRDRPHPRRPHPGDLLRPRTAMTTFRGSCHCGAVAYEVEGELDSALACNCSICQRKGSLLWFVPRAALRLVTPESASRVYEFNKRVI